MPQAFTNTVLGDIKPFSTPESPHLQTSAAKKTFYIDVVHFDALLPFSLDPCISLSCSFLSPLLLCNILLLKPLPGSSQKLNPLFSSLSFISTKLPNLFHADIRKEAIWLKKKSYLGVSDWYYTHGSIWFCLKEGYAPKSEHVLISIQDVWLPRAEF